MRKAVLLVQAGKEYYLVESANLNESKMVKGESFYDGKGNIRVWGTGHVYNIDSKKIVATPDQIGIIEESQENNATCVRDMIQCDFDLISNRAGKCKVEVDGLPYPDGASRPIYYQHKVLIHI